MAEIPYENFLPQNISLAEFERLPDLQPKVFQYGLVTAEELLAQVKTKKVFNLPKIHAVSPIFQIVNAPKTRILKQKARITFEIKSNEDLHFHLVNELDEWIPFEKKENAYVLNFIPYNFGEIHINVETLEGHYAVLVYEVR